MKNFILLIILMGYTFAQVEVKVNKKEISPNEQIIFQITATGKNIKFPKINYISDYKVTSGAISQNISIINQKVYLSVSKNYIFTPSKDVTIPSFEVTVDGKKFYTKPVKIKVTDSTENKNCTLIAIIDKNETFLGQNRILTLSFCQKNPNNREIKIKSPVTKNFIISKISTKSYNKKNEKITEYKFLIIPKKDGLFTIKPFKIQIFKKENPIDNPFFSPLVLEKNIISNEITLKVKPIPKNSIWGNFQINLYADKNEVKKSNPLNITMKLTGCGDFYSVENKNFLNQNSKKTLTLYYKNNALCGIYEEKTTLFPKKDLNLSITIKEFNGTLNQIKSNILFIKVK